jgi:hypothetical protein
MSTFWRIALGAQAPEISGLPSAFLGAGPEGGQLDLPRPAGCCAGAATGSQQEADRPDLAGNFFRSQTHLFYP